MTNPTEVSEEERKKALAALQEIQNNVTAYGAFSVAVQQHLRKQFEIVRAALLRSPQQEKGERIEGWAWDVDLTRPGFTTTEADWPQIDPREITHATLILHPIPVSTGEDDGR